MLTAKVKKIFLTVTEELEWMPPMLGERNPNLKLMYTLMIQHDTSKLSYAIRTDKRHPVWSLQLDEHEDVETWRWTDLHGQSYEVPWASTPAARRGVEVWLQLT